MDKYTIDANRDPYKTKIFRNGEQMGCVQRLKLSQGVDDYCRLTLDLVPDEVAVEVEGAVVVERYNVMPTRFIRRRGYNPYDSDGRL